jgi:hypothetical protein
MIATATLLDGKMMISDLEIIQPVSFEWRITGDAIEFW